MCLPSARLAFCRRVERGEWDGRHLTHARTGWTTQGSGGGSVLPSGPTRGARRCRSATGPSRPCTTTKLHAGQLGQKHICKCDLTPSMCACVGILVVESNLCMTFVSLPCLEKTCVGAGVLIALHCGLRTACTNSPVPTGPLLRSCLSLCVIVHSPAHRCVHTYHSDRSSICLFCCWGSGYHLPGDGDGTFGSFGVGRLLFRLGGLLYVHCPPPGPVASCPAASPACRDVNSPTIQRGTSGRIGQI